MSAGVRLLPLGVVHVVLDDADRHAEEAVDPAHPLGVAAGEVVVHRDDMDALAFERIQVSRQRGNERLALAGLHLGDHALVQHAAADQLHVEVPHVQHAAARFADHGERRHEQVVERFAGREALAKLVGFRAKLIVAQRLSRRLECVDFADERVEALELAFILRADDLREQFLDHLESGS